MSVFATEYKKMLVPASEVRGPYVNDDPYQEEDVGPDHTADLVYAPFADDWKRVAKVARTPSPGVVVITAEGLEPWFRDSWEPVEILRPTHRPPFEAGLSGYHR